MGQFGEYIKMAIDNILANKGRSLLTMLGIIIGISSVITVVSIGMGVKNDVQKQTSTTSKSAVINAAQEDTPLEIITMDDLQAVKESLGDRLLGAVVSGGAMSTSTTGKGNFETTITLTTPDEKLNPYAQPLIKGTYFTEEDINNESMVCVMDKMSAVKMFGTTDVIGMDFEMTIDNVIQDVRVIGIMDVSKEQVDSQKQMEELFGADKSVSVVMPYTTSTVLGKTIEKFTSMTLYPNKPEEGVAVSKIAIRVLASRHLGDGEDLFQKQKDIDLSSYIGNVMNAVTGFIALVAGISLLVGGIGVMNIMLVSVTERTREIGIRKALGARTGSIVTQFLCESAIISGIGGVIGIILGVSLSLLLSKVVDGLSAQIGWQVVLIATVFSCGVGIVFGIYPARKAAKMSPIEALRQM